MEADQADSPGDSSPDPGLSRFIVNKEPRRYFGAKTALHLGDPERMRQGCYSLRQRTPSRTLLPPAGRLAGVRAMVAMVIMTRSTHMPALTHSPAHAGSFHNVLKGSPTV